METGVKMNLLYKKGINKVTWRALNIAKNVWYTSRSMLSDSDPRSQAAITVIVIQATVLKPELLDSLIHCY